MIKDIYYSMCYMFAKQWLNYNFWKEEHLERRDYISKVIVNKRISIEHDAEQIHKIWSNWYKHQRDNSSQYNINKWNIQCETEYKNLSEEDKQKDRDIIIKYFN